MNYRTPCGITVQEQFDFFPPGSWQLMVLHSSFLGYNMEKLLTATEEKVLKKVFKLVHWHARAQISWRNRPWAHWTILFTRNLSNTADQHSKEGINAQYTWECVLATENEWLQSQAVILVGEVWCLQTMLCITKFLIFHCFIYCSFTNNLHHFLFSLQLFVLSPYNIIAMFWGIYPFTDSSVICNYTKLQHL